MARFDLTSFFAATSFFIVVVLFIKDALSFFDFLQFLLLSQGVVFLAGAISNSSKYQSDDSNINDASHLKYINFNSPTRFDPVRYILGLCFFFIGCIIDKLY